MGDILLVDDDDQLRDSFHKLLTMEGHAVRTAASGDKCLVLVEDLMPEAVIMDVRMPGMDGLATLKALHAKEPRLPVIIMTAYSTTEAAIEAMKFGAFDYILKPFEIPEILNLLERALEAGRLMQERVVLSEEDESGSGVLIGVGRAMHTVYKAIGKVAPTDAVVLLRGESGTGKELVARALYQHSLRSKMPLSIVNCVAIPDTLMESELFGYERGAFTGAVSRRIGKVEQASGGTVFLDEVGDMPVAVQGKLLRLLQENQIERIGGREPIDVDVRIIAATNRDLETAVSEGRFREDLYYRLNVISLHLPALRERTEDIPPLVHHFLRNISRKMNIPIPKISEQAMVLFAQHSWYGNVRELRNVVQQLLVFNRGESISFSAVQSVFAGPGEGGQIHQEEPREHVLRDFVLYELQKASGSKSFDFLMDSMGKTIIREALLLCAGNRSHAARMLGLSRPTVIAKIDKYGL